MKHLLTIFWVLSTVLSFGQELDSLKQALLTAKDDTAQAVLYNDLAWEFRKSDLDSAVVYNKQGIELAEQIQNLDALERAYNIKGVLKAMIGEYEAALKGFARALKINRELHDTDGVATCYNNLGLVYYYLSDYVKAIENYNLAVREYDSMGESKGKAATYNNIALIYEMQHEFDQAIDYNKKALKIRQAHDMEYEIAFSQANLGNCHFNKEEYDEALGYFVLSLKTFEKYNDVGSLGKVYLHLGTIYFENDEIEKALENSLRGLDMQQQMGDRRGASIAMQQIGKFYNAQNKLNLSLQYLDSAKAIQEELGVLEELVKSISYLAEVRYKRGEFELAYLDAKEYIAINDSIVNQSTNEKMAELQTEFETEQKEREIKILTQEKELQSLQIDQGRWLLVGSSVVIVLVLALALMMLRNYRNKKKAYVELEDKNDEIIAQKHIIEEANKDITDSIQYAKRIQEAILTSDDYMDCMFADHFTLFKPKDIVSGDYYWAYNTKSDKSIWAVADCTGHGVPGAFMSMIGNSLLNEIIIENGVEQTDVVLTRMREKIIAALDQKGTTGEQQDGMDMSLCLLNRKTNVMDFTGANNPVWVVRKVDEGAMIALTDGTEIKQSRYANGYGLYSIKGDKCPVGIYGDKMTEFTSKQIQLNKDDLVYLFSDGYADQFGGTKGKKLKTVEFQRIVLRIAGDSMKMQQKALDDSIEQWRGNLMQLDDICVFGVKI